MRRYYNMSRRKLIREVLRLSYENAKLLSIFEFAKDEFEKRNKKIAFLSLELERARAKIKVLEKKISSLEEENKRLKGVNKLLAKKIFSRKNERREEKKEEQEEKPKKRGAIKGHKGYGRKIPNLPVKKVILDI